MRLPVDEGARPAAGAQDRRQPAPSGILPHSSPGVADRIQFRPKHGFERCFAVAQDQAWIGLEGGTMRQRAWSAREACPDRSPARFDDAGLCLILNRFGS
jgi:hypothetical protein